MNSLGVVAYVAVVMSVLLSAETSAEPQRFAIFEATGTIDRTDFGMTYRAPFVGEEVRFTITMEARVR